MLDEPVHRRHQHELGRDADQVRHRLGGQLGAALGQRLVDAARTVVGELDPRVARDADAGRRPRVHVEPEQLDGVGVALVDGRRPLRVRAEHEDPDHVVVPEVDRGGLRSTVVRLIEAGWTEAAGTTQGDQRGEDRPPGQAAQRAGAGSRRLLRAEGRAVVVRDVVPEDRPGAVLLLEHEAADQGEVAGLLRRSSSPRSRSRPPPSPRRRRRRTPGTTSAASSLVARTDSASWTPAAVSRSMSSAALSAAPLVVKTSKDATKSSRGKSPRNAPTTYCDSTSPTAVSISVRSCSGSFPAPRTVSTRRATDSRPRRWLGPAGPCTPPARGRSATTSAASAARARVPGSPPCAP